MPILGELPYFYWRSDYFGDAMIIFLNLFGGMVRDGNELIGATSGAEVGLAQGLYEELDAEASKWVENAEPRVSEIFVVHLPVILSGDMTITDMICV